MFQVAFIGRPNRRFKLSTGQLVVRSDIAPIVRGNLRGEIDCSLETTDDSLRIAFGFDLYMYVTSTLPCEQAVAEAVRDGLCVESGVHNGYWDEDLDGPDAVYCPEVTFRDRLSHLADRGRRILRIG